MVNKSLLNDIKVEQKLINKLFKMYFFFKIQDSKQIKELNNNELNTILNLIVKILLFIKKYDKLIKNKFRTLALQMFYILIELNYFKKENMSSLKFWLGDFPWIKLNNITPINYEEKIFNLFETELKKNNKILFKGQEELYNSLEKNINILVNAPTSFGKTEIILEKIGLNSCIVVPTIALMNEIANELRKKYKSNVINNSHTKYSKNNVYILTPEKLLNFLNLNKNAKFNKIVFDEFHSILANDSRSFLLKWLVEFIFKNNKTNNFVFLCPNASLGIFKNKLNNDLYNSITQLNLSYSFLTNRILFSISKEYDVEYYNEIFNKTILICNIEDKISNSLNFKNLDFDYSLDHDKKENKINKNKNKFKRLYFLLNNIKEPPIIYSSKQNMKNVAEFIYNNLNKKYFSEIEDIKVLIQYYNQFIGSEYSNLKYVKHGILIHNGDVDKTSKLLIENIYKLSKFPLIANQTIISGVNLNCKNLILMLNRTNNKKVIYGNFRNLIGRVGRYNPKDNDSYLGTVFLMENPNYKEIFKEELLEEDFQENDYKLLKQNIEENDKYELALEKQLYKSSLNNETKFFPFLISDNETKEGIDKRILENKEYFEDFFNTQVNKERDYTLFINKLDFIFDWKTRNPFTENTNKINFKLLLSMYYNYYAKGITIKKMANNFHNYAIKEGKKYFVGKWWGKKYLTTKNDLSNNLPEAKMSDYIDITIATINNWIESHLFCYIYYILTIIVENGSKKINFEEINYLGNIDSNIEKELNELGIERHLIRQFSSVLKNPKNISEIFDFIRENKDKKPVLFAILKCMNLI